METVTKIVSFILPVKSVCVTRLLILHSRLHI